jgi:small subunit ribosomal protein S20
MKRHRQSLKRRARNRVSKTRIKNTVKAVRLAIEEKDTTKAHRPPPDRRQQDRGIAVIHRNIAARRTIRAAGFLRWPERICAES